MNLAPPGADPLRSIFFVNFNQDGSSVAVGTVNGYKLYSLQNPDSLDLIYSYDGSDVLIVERLFNSSLVALVSVSCPRKLKVCHFKKGTEICNYSYPNIIVTVRMNRSRLVVILSESIYIHNITNMKVIHTIRDTPANETGACALSTLPEEGGNYLAYPGRENTGEVLLFDTVNLVAHMTILAHNSPLAAIAFSPDRPLLATASEKGTVIRVFDVRDGSRVMEFRRGIKRCVSIYSLAFSACGQYLCSTSNTETVHIFKLDQGNERSTGAAASATAATSAGDGARRGEKTEEKAEAQSWMGFLGSMVGPTVSLIPQQPRSFACAKLPVGGQRTMCTVTVGRDNAPPRVLIASGDGMLYVYTINPAEGGECARYHVHSLRDGLASEVEPSENVGVAAGGLAGISTGSGSSGDRSAVVTAGTAAASSLGDDDSPPSHFGGAGDDC